MSYKLTDEAREDVRGITRYTLRHWGKRQMLIYRDELEAAFRGLGKDPAPATSRSRDDLLPGCRIIAVGKHFVVYRQSGDGVEILRILHQAMQLSRHRLV
jgi:toxin ParE1/3/4